jgi:hypothetical protein
VGARYAYKPYTPPKDESFYFDWYERHTKNCAGEQGQRQQCSVARWPNYSRYLALRTSVLTCRA